MGEFEGVGAVQGVHPVTGYHWFRAGRLPVPARRAGRLILVDAVPVPVPVPVPAGLAAVDACVSSAGQRSDLDRQVARVTAWAAGEGLAAGRVMTAAGPRARIDRG